VPSQRFDQARPFATLGVVIALWLIIPAAVKSLARATFFEFTAPVLASASYVRDLQEYWSLRAHSNQQLIEAGRDLARVNSSYDVTVQRNVQLEGELARLEPMLHLPPVPGYRLEVARVAQRDLASGWWQRLVIRKGRNYGIPVGAPVVFGGGVVGRIAEVGAYTAVVELISSPGVRLAAVVEGDTRPISYAGGDNPTFGQPRGLVEFLPLDVFAQASAPHRVVTSGLGGVFPPGLTIGQLVKIETSNDGLFNTGVVQLDPRLSDLTEVSVLVPGTLPADPPPVEAPPS
jgi:rod shape-determining protein MreC